MNFLEYLGIGFIFSVMVIVFGFVIAYVIVMVGEPTGYDEQQAQHDKDALLKAANSEVDQYRKKGAL